MIDSGKNYDIEVTLKDDTFLWATVSEKELEHIAYYLNNAQFVIFSCPKNGYDYSIINRDMIVRIDIYEDEKELL